MANEVPLEVLSPNAPLNNMVDGPLMPDILAERVKLIGHLRKSPVILYGIFLEVLRGIYKDANGLPIDIDMTWDPDPAVSKVWIDTDYKWEDSTVEKRPAIYIKLNTISYDKSSQVVGRNDALAGYDLVEGTQEYCRSGAGSVSFVHIGRQRGESIALASCTFDYLDAFSTIIRDDFCFKVFRPVEIQPLVHDRESNERYRSVVTFEFTFDDTWELKLESQKLKTIILNAGGGLYARLAGV